MRIRQVDFKRIELPLAEPYVVAYESFDRAENVLLRLTTADGLEAYGCAVAESEVTGESTADVLVALETIVAPTLVGSNPLFRARLLEALAEPLRDRPATLAAVDMALFDLLGKVAGLPLWQLLGGFRNRMKTSITVGILPTEETVERSLARVEEGFSCLKIKGGLDVEADIVRIRRVRRAVGPGVELRFDANQGYSEAETVHFVEETRSAGLELIEQPTPAGRLDELGRVTNAVGLPVMADESVLRLRDAFRLARDGLVDMLNVKLMKVGGIEVSRRIAAIARASRMEVMVGCMDECELAIAAGLHFALAHSQVVYADLDGHLDLLDDPTRGTLRLERGVLYPSPLPGLGCTRLRW